MGLITFSLHRCFYPPRNLRAIVSTYWSVHTAWEFISQPGPRVIQTTPNHYISSQSIGPNVIILINNSQSLFFSMQLLSPTVIEPHPTTPFHHVRIRISNMPEQFFHASLLHGSSEFHIPTASYSMWFISVGDPTLYHLQKGRYHLPGKPGNGFPLPHLPRR